MPLEAVGKYNISIPFDRITYIYWQVRDAAMFVSRKRFFRRILLCQETYRSDRLIWIDGTSMTLFPLEYRIFRQADYIASRLIAFRDPKGVCSSQIMSRRLTFQGSARFYLKQRMYYYRVNSYRPCRRWTCNCGRGMREWGNEGGTEVWEE
jgi:hypothetical protein